MFESDSLIQHHHEAELNRIVKSSIDWVNRRGPDAGASFSHCNESRGDKLVIGVVSWHAIHASNLAETASRPSECACTIF